MTEKGSLSTVVTESEYNLEEHDGTPHDQHDMRRVGKTQELNRNFRFLSILGFTCVLMSTWEGMFTASTFGLINGGFAGIIWTYVGTVVFYTAAIASMAEMASMAPTSGGQYHWVSEFAPAKAQRILSYTVGWLCVLGWQTGIAATAFLAGTIIQGLLVLNYPSYSYQRWHGTLLVIAITLFSLLFNILLGRRLPLAETITLFLHIFGFIAILATLWALVPRSNVYNTSSAVFTQFTDGGGWGNTGLSCLIGMLSSVFAFLGPDSAVHLAEELKDASYILPRAMMWTAVINGSLGFVMLVTFCFCLGNLGDALSTPTGYPFIQVFYAVTGSHAGTSIMTCILVVLAICGCICNVATASRQMWAFARDRGLPFSGWLSKVTVISGNPIPLNSLIVSFVITVLLSLINIGSTIAFNNIVSLGVAALISSYAISISCLLIRKLRQPKTLPSARWTMGKYGIFVNAISVAYLLLVFIMSFFPQVPSPVPANFNWSIVIYGAVVLWSAAYFMLKGRRVYHGPVVLCRRLD